MQDEISEQILRISNLEKALAHVQRKVSSEPHPLLVKEGRVDIPSLDVETRTIPSDKSALVLRTRSDEADDLVEVFGMMSVKSNPFHSGTATSEVRLY